VFRLEGHECKRTYDAPWLYDSEGCQFHRQLEPWFLTTSAGFLYSLKQKYFAKTQDRFADEYRPYIDHAVSIHRRTMPENLPRSVA
jgi:hypothetical protein